MPDNRPTVFQTVGDVSLKGENLVDAGAILTGAANMVMGGMLPLMAGFGAPLVAGSLTAVSVATTAGRLYQERSKPNDSQEVKSLKTEFRKAAGGFLAKQVASAALMVVSFAAYVQTFAKVLALGSGESALALAIASGVVAAGLGLWARISNKKMNACDAAIRKAQQPAPTA